MKGRSSYLQSNDSVEGKHAALEDVPCFLPVVPKTTSCNPNWFQQIEYLLNQPNRVTLKNWNLMILDTGGQKGKRLSSKSNKPYTTRMLKVVRFQQSVEILLAVQVPPKLLAADRKYPLSQRSYYWLTGSKGTVTLCNVKDIGISWDSEDSGP